MSKMKAGPAQNSIKQKAIKVLKQKKLYEGQKDQLMQQSFNMEQANMATENLRNTVITVDAMKDANKALKAQYKKINVDKIESVQDEMEDLLEQANEVQETLGRSYALGDDIDEEDLEAELEALGDDLLFEDEEGEPSYLQEPSLPLSLPNAATNELQVSFFYEIVFNILYSLNKNHLLLCTLLNKVLFFVRISFNLISIFLFFQERNVKEIQI